MRTKTFVVLTVMVAACGPELAWEEPTGEQLEAAGEEPSGGTDSAGGATGGTGTSGGTGATGGTVGSGGTGPACSVANAVIVTLQAGVNLSPNGARDTWIGESAPLTNNYGTDLCNATGNFPSGGKDRACLLRWDVAQVVPQGKIVLDAWLHITVFDASQQRYPVYFLSRPWDPSFASWMNASSQASWDVPGAKGLQDRYSTPLFVDLLGDVVGTHIVFAGSAAVPMVQAWVNNPANNHGLIIAHPTNTDNLRIRGSLAANPAERPGLGIRYCP